VPLTPREPDTSIDLAARCRRLASGALSYDVVQQLEAIAAECEARSEQANQSGHPPSSPGLCHGRTI
jgi:hypothetical protein